MDIETLGLSNVPIILIGVAEIKKDRIISSQYFLRDIYEEGAVIEAYLSHLDDDSVHVTFNGKSFDVPFIKNRCLYNRINANLDLPHLDLMYFAKNLWKDDSALKGKGMFPANTFRIIIILTWTSKISVQLFQS